MGISLEIVLNQRNIAFRPGDIVAGHVVVRNNGQNPVHFNGKYGIGFIFSNEFGCETRSKIQN